MKWQPIETAPKDGTPFLAAWKWGGRFSAGGDWCYVVMFCQDGEFLVCWDYKDSAAPTHWKPIKQPKIKKKEQ